METLTSIEQSLQSPYRAGNTYYRMNPNSFYTEGVRAFMKKAHCQWFYDIIELELYHVLKNRGIIDMYVLQVHCLYHTANLYLIDDTGHILWQKSVAYTDMPEGKIKLMIGFDGRRIATCLAIEH